MSSILTILLFQSLLPQESEAAIVDKVLAQVGDSIVTQYDIEAYAPVRVRYINSLPDGEREQVWQDYYETTMGQYIEAYVVEMASARMGVTTNDEEVDQAILVLQEQNSEFQAELRGIMSREGAVTPEIRLYVKSIVLQQKLLPMLHYRSVITDEDILRYMREDMNVEPEETEYKVKMLFLPNAELYNDIKPRLAENFDNIPNETGASLADMGFIHASSLLPEMGAIVRGLKAGEISEAYVDNDGRYVVIKVEETRASTGISEIDREYLMNTLRSRQMEMIFNNWLERQRNTIIIHRYDS